MFLATDKGECVDVAFVAQGLEHWSCKPGVESSNLSEGFSTTAAQLSDKEQYWFFLANAINELKEYERRGEYVVSIGRSTVKSSV